MTEPSKVVHMTTVHHPYDTRIYHKECKSLQKAGFDVSLIASAGTDENLEKSAIPIKPIKKRSNRWLRMTLSTFQAYRKAKQMQADYYHIHDPELLPVAWLLQKQGNTVIYDIHEDYVTSIYQKEYIAKPIRKLIAFLYRHTENLFSRRLELCLAEKYYKEKYPSGICILNYPTLNEKMLNHHRGTQPAENKLLYTGNVTAERGAYIHARLPVVDKDITVHFVGKCDQRIANKMYDVAGEAKNNLVIEGIGRFVEREQIDESYINRNWLAGIALFPPTDHYMKKELTKFFEYMSAGIPIICSDFPVWKKFIEMYDCGIAVDPNNAEKIREAIAFLRTNPGRAAQMGDNGKRAVQKVLNWKSEEDKLIRWYQNIGRQSAVSN